MARPRRSQKDSPSTRERALGVATRLMQERGYNGFSFKDVAREVGVSHVAVHHHFPAKAELVKIAMATYTGAFQELLARITAKKLAPPEALRAFGQLFADTLDDSRRICLCGMLTAEYATLPAQVQPEVLRFHELSETWLAEVIHAARRGSTRGATDRSLARAFLSALEGSLMSSRAFGDSDRLTATVEWFVGSLPSVSTPRRRSAGRG